MFSFVVFSDGKGYGRWESNPQRPCLLIGAAPSLVACVATFDAIRAVAGLLARDAYPFALSLQCLHRRGLTGFRLKWGGRFLPYWVKFTPVHPLVSARK